MDSQNAYAQVLSSMPSFPLSWTLNAAATLRQVFFRSCPGEHILVIDLPGVDGVVLHKLDPMTSLPNSLRMMIQGMSEAEFEREGAGNASDIDEMNIPALMGE